jgi:hypothetical protein
MSTIKSSAENLTLNADGANNDIKFQSNGSEVASIDQAGVLAAGGATLTGNITHAGDLTLDVGGDISLDADGGDILLKDGGTTFGTLSNDGGYFDIKSTTSNQDISIKGNDGGSTVTAVRFDMSDGGKAIFNNGVAIGGTGAANTLDDYEEGTFTVGNGNVTVNSGTLTWRGTYVKIGSLVTFNIVQLTGNITWAVPQVITGLPFDIEADQYSCAVYTNEDPTIFGGMLAWHTNNYLYFQAAGTNQIHICISGSYHTND